MYAECCDHYQENLNIVFNTKNVWKSVYIAKEMEESSKNQEIGIYTLCNLW